MPEKQIAPVAVSVKDIRKVFITEGRETAALAGVSLDFRAGSFTTLLGPSGCGKTTLLRIIAGFTKTEVGSVSIGGNDIGTLPPWKRNIGFVFQNYALWPHMSVRDNIAYGLRLRHLPRAEIEPRVAQALKDIGLSELANRLPGQLSGGQQQRVALARALVLRPQVLLLDEPLSNLDAKLRVELRKEIRRIQRAVGITTIYVTHDQEEALEISDVVAVMSQGHIEQVGAPEDVYQHPASSFVATFVGTVNLLVGQVTRDGSLRMEGGLTLPLALDAAHAGRSITIALRPENVSIVAANTSALKGTVVRTSFLGSVRRVILDLGGMNLATEYRGRLVEGDVVGVEIREYVVIP